MSRPFATAWSVVSLIGIPMILLNTIGASCLAEMIHMVVRNRERLASIQAHKAMAIANLTVSHLREGLNQRSARATVRIIHEQTRLTGVAVTDDRRLLAYAGAGEDLFPAGGDVITETTRQVLNTGEPAFKQGRTVLGRDVPHPMFTSAIVVPLKKSGHTIGTLKFYGDKKHPLSNIDFEIAAGLAELFSTQLELEDIQIKARLAARAEIKRLRAQINPHFLFNSLNTIASFCRTNSQRARQLLLELSNYMRRNIEDKREYISLDEELEQIGSYLAIEHARFGERIRFEMNIEPGTGQWPLPPLIVQPLVENAVKHGVSAKEEGGNIRIGAAVDNGNLRIEIEDDGIGMPQASIDQIFQKDDDRAGSRGMGLRNVNQRLEHIYGPAHRLRIQSRPGHGTTVMVNLPPMEHNPEG